MINASLVITEKCNLEIRNPRSDELFSWRDTVAQLQERAFNCKKKNRGDSVNADLHTNERGRRRKIDIVRPAEFADAVNDQFLHQVGAVSEAGDEGSAWNSDAAEWQPIALRAHEQPGEANREKRELPNDCREFQILAFAKPERESDQAERRQPKPDGEIH